MPKTDFNILLNDVPLPDDELVHLLKALGHPSRVALIEHLSKNETCCGGDLCGCLNLAQSTISQHLEMLKNIGLVEMRTCGTKSIFRLNRDKLWKLGSALQAISQCECCEDPRQVNSKNVSKENLKKKAT